MITEQNARILMPWLVTIVIFVLWEAVCRVFSVPIFILPPPTAVFKALVEFATPIAWHSWQTLMTTTVGFAFAVVGGMLIGIMIGASRIIYSGFYPVLIGFNSIPKVAIVPLLVIWFGIGTVPAIITAFVISFFPIVVNVATGLATIEPEMRDVLRSLGATKREILLKVGIPRSLPYLFASLKIAVTLAFVGSVISETVASNAGIGFLILSAASSFNVALVFAGLIVIAVMGILLYLVCVFFEKRMTGWAFRGDLMT